MSNIIASLAFTKQVTNRRVVFLYYTSDNLQRRKY